MDCSTIDLSIVPVPQGKDVLGEVLRQGAQKLLAEAIDAEVADWIDRHAHLRDDAGHRQVVRNGACRLGRSPPASGQSKSSNHGCTTGARERNARSLPRRSCRPTYARPRASRS